MTAGALYVCQCCLQVSTSVARTSHCCQRQSQQHNIGVMTATAFYGLQERPRTQHLVRPVEPGRAQISHPEPQPRRRDAVTVKHLQSVRDVQLKGRRSARLPALMRLGTTKQQ